MDSPDRFLRRGGRLLAAEGLRWPVTPSGLHHTLPGWGLPEVDAEAWRLVVGGHTQYALGLSLSGLRRRPSRTVAVVLQTPGMPGAASQARWTGTPLAAILEEASPLAGARQVVFHGLDRGIADGEVGQGQVRLSLPTASDEDVLLAWAMNGEPLPLEHGYPLRLLVPGREERASLRWLGAISIAEAGSPEDGEPTPLPPQALLLPPGLLDQAGGRWVVEPGAVTLSGRAWSGGRLGGVELTTDGGGSWRPAALAEPGDRGAWRQWMASWPATRGRHRVGCRAWDEGGGPGEASFLDLELRG